MDDTSGTRPKVKRRKVVININILDLSETILYHVSSYLTKPSVAIFAVAYEDLSNNPKNQSSTIVSYQKKLDPSFWDELDFEYIEKCLCESAIIL